MIAVMWKFRTSARLYVDMIGPTMEPSLQECTPAAAPHSFVLCCSCSFILRVSYAISQCQVRELACEELPRETIFSTTLLWYDHIEEHLTILVCI